MITLSFQSFLLIASLAVSGMSQGQADGAQARFLERIRVLGVQETRGEVTVLDPDGKSRTWQEGDRIAEENATVKKITRSTVVLTRIVEGSRGEKGESLIVLRFDATGKVKVREYSSVSDAPQPVAPPR